MNLSILKQKINKNPRSKYIIHKLIMNPQGACPRKWVKWFVNPIIFFSSKGKGAKIRSYTIMNISPINQFTLGSNSVIEYFSLIDNGVGSVHIGNNTRIGLRNTIIGPARIGDNTILAQNVVVSGLNHNYKNINLPIRKQGVTVSPIVIEDEVWIGANCIITAGVHIGKHTVIAGGSVVTKNIPDYSIAAGNPAKIIKQYDPDKGEWIKV
ncbi:acyltransferase [Parabacteroides pacaensis]|uniref:acyltransferase n=1 Tax=Parabacteroides pacaensis TaxID=2086575 RepID=UPI000D0ECC1B|nr:acyltransferase [Parabacteroides pacaensis]